MVSKLIITVKSYSFSMKSWVTAKQESSWNRLKIHYPSILFLTAATPVMQFLVLPLWIHAAWANNFSSIAIHIQYTPQDMQRNMDNYRSYGKVVSMLRYLSSLSLCNFFIFYHLYTSFPCEKYGENVGFLSSSINNSIERFKLQSYFFYHHWY